MPDLREQVVTQAGSWSAMGLLHARTLQRKISCSEADMTIKQMIRSKAES